MSGDTDAIVIQIPVSRVFFEHVKQGGYDSPMRKALIQELGTMAIEQGLGALRDEQGSQATKAGNA